MLLYMRDRKQQKIGRYTSKVGVVKKLKGVVSDDILFSFVDGDKEDTPKRIIRFIEEYPEWDDEKIAEAVINEEEELYE